MNTETTTVQEAEKNLTCPMAVIKRREGEQYSDFKKIQAEVNKEIRLFCKGLLFHDSSTGIYDIGSNKMKAERKITHDKLTHIRKVNKRKKA